MTSNILFICFFSFIGILLLYLVYLWLGMRHVLKQYIETKNLMNQIPSTYIDERTNSVTYFYISKNSENHWVIGYRNGTIHSVSISDYDFNKALHKLNEQVSETETE